MISSLRFYCLGLTLSLISKRHNYLSTILHHIKIKVANLNIHWKQYQPDLKMNCPPFVWKELLSNLKHRFYTVRFSLKSNTLVDAFFINNRFNKYESYRTYKMFRGTMYTRQSAKCLCGLLLVHLRTVKPWNVMLIK